MNIEKRVSVLGKSIAMPLIGIVNGLDQIDHCEESKNYLNGGDRVVVFEEKFVEYQSFDSLKIKNVLAYRIRGVEGWFLAEDFQ